MAERNSDSIQLARQWGLLRILAERPGGYTVKELAEQFGVSKLTVARDLATLNSLFGIVEESEGKQKKRYRVTGDLKALEGIRFLPMELLGLYAARVALAPAAGAPFYADLQSALAKVRGAVGARLNGAIDALASVFLPHTRRYIDYKRHADAIETLVDAIARRLACEATYRAGGRDAARQHVIHPLRLIFHEGALYLVCRFMPKGHLGTLAVHRIVSIRRTDERFRPPRVDLASWARPAFGIFHGGPEEEVEAVFAKELSWLAEERIFHPDEQKKRLKDGRIRYRVRTSARGEVVSWVMRFGGKVELLRPEAWRSDVARLSAEMAGAHRG